MGQNIKSFAADKPARRETMPKTAAVFNVETSYRQLNKQLAWSNGNPVCDIFIRLAVVGSQACEILRNSEKIRTYSRSKSSKVLDPGVSRKSICYFLLVINSNFERISYRFRDNDV